MASSHRSDGPLTPQTLLYLTISSDWYTLGGFTEASPWVPHDFVMPSLLTCSPTFQSESNHAKQGDPILLTRGEERLFEAKVDISRCIGWVFRHCQSRFTDIPPDFATNISEAQPGDRRRNVAQNTRDALNPPWKFGHDVTDLPAICDITESLSCGRSRRSPRDNAEYSHPSVRVVSAEVGPYPRADVAKRLGTLSSPVTANSQN